MKQTTQPDAPVMVRFDRQRRQNYHLMPDGTRVYHEVPSGFVFDSRGRLKAVPAEGEGE